MLINTNIETLHEYNIVTCCQKHNLPFFVLSETQLTFFCTVRNTTYLAVHKQYYCNMQYQNYN